MHTDSPSRASVPGHEASLSTRPTPPSPPPPHDLLALPSSFGRLRPPPVQEPSPSPPPPSLLPVPAVASADVVPIAASGLPPLRTCHSEHERRPQLHIAASGLPPPGNHWTVCCCCGCRLAQFVLCMACHENYEPN